MNQLKHAIEKAFAPRPCPACSADEKLKPSESLITVIHLVVVENFDGIYDIKDRLCEKHLEYLRFVEKAYKEHDKGNHT